jgi:hypothetical protein
MSNKLVDVRSKRNGRLKEFCKLATQTPKALTNSLVELTEIGPRGILEMKLPFAPVFFRS